MKNPFKKSFTQSELNLFRFLARVKLFENLEYDELALFIPVMYEREYKLDEVVFFRDDPSQALYIIRKGEVSLSVDIGDKFENLTTVGTNKAFGDNALVDDGRRIYTAIVTSETADMYVIPQDNIQNIFSKNTEVKAKMLYSLAELYNSYTVNLFKAYKSSFGFFDLGQAYKDI